MWRRWSPASSTCRALSCCPSRRAFPPGAGRHPGWRCGPGTLLCVAHTLSRPRSLSPAPLPPPLQVFLVSARDALRSRLALRPADADDDLDAFRKVAFGKHWGRVTDPETIRCAGGAAGGAGVGVGRRLPAAQPPADWGSSGMLPGGCMATPPASACLAARDRCPASTPTRPCQPCGRPLLAPLRAGRRRWRCWRLRVCPSWRRVCWASWAAAPRCCTWWRCWTMWSACWRRCAPARARTRMRWRARAWCLQPRVAALLKQLAPGLACLLSAQPALPQLRRCMSPSTHTLSLLPRPAGAQPGQRQRGLAAPGRGGAVGDGRVAAGAAGGHAGPV